MKLLKVLKFYENFEFFKKIWNFKKFFEIFKLKKKLTFKLIFV
jgi:hypothetical protein